ncbi:tol-pal system protein YbgF [Nitratidesulfovibrio liaohensis]|uniref:Tol-pal system protein YbgF n=1 Tax=Nitratidesulfovibrio liaohensis TaxID=2604158 RepID=A0ABY9R5S8_9BACT|nr:tol-pal system protein YbgF [Nitratidesulfovibrio liaohensis]WMW66393.1 tol-pal system protein YbgF [Nitratidesulfovibrio liaohensis]
MQHRRLRTSAALLVPALLFATVLCSGCAGQGAGQGAAQGSTEWRLRMLEEKYLSYEEARKARDGSVDERLRALEEKQAALSARVDGDRESDGRRLDALEGALAGKAGGASGAAPVASMPAMASEGTPPVDADDFGKGGRRVQPEPVKAAPVAKAAQKPEPKSAKSVSDKAAYESALNLLQRGKTDEARVRFEGFLGDYPNSALVPNALYWKGEALYAQRRYADAIVAFKEVTARFPKHHKAADSLLKTALAYKQLGDDENVRFHLKALREDHPGSPAAKLARQRFPNG